MAKLQLLLQSTTVKVPWTISTWLSVKDILVELFHCLKETSNIDKGTESFTRIIHLDLSVFLLWPVATQLRHVAGHWCYWQPVS